MNEQYRMRVKAPMLHLAERNLLLKVFQERMEQGEISKDMPCEIRLLLGRRYKRKRGAEVVFGMALQRGDEEKLPKSVMRTYRIRLHDGWLILSVQVRHKAKLSKEEIDFAKVLVADMAEELKLFANDDCFVIMGVKKLIEKIASETGISDPTAWTREYLAPPSYMERPEVRRYYRLRNKHLDHAQPQNLLRRSTDELVEIPV